MVTPDSTLLTWVPVGCLGVFRSVAYPDFAPARQAASNKEMRARTQVT